MTRGPEQYVAAYAFSGAEPWGVWDRARARYVPDFSATTRTEARDKSDELNRASKGDV